MKYKILMVLIFGLIFISNVAGADINNGTLNLNLSNTSILLQNVESVQITLVKVEYDLENIILENNEALPLNLSFSLAAGTYKIYVKKDDSTVLEYNNDKNGYAIAPHSKVTIPDNSNISVEWTNTLGTDVLSDAPWRINNNEYIPFTYVVKDTALLPLYIRTIEIYDDDEPIGNEANDTLVYTHPLWQWFAQDLWYDTDTLSPFIFEEDDDFLETHVKFDIAAQFDVHNYYTVYTSPFNLPSLPDWYYGDTHYHSSFSDNVYEFGAPVEPTAMSGKAAGLDWVTITDHSFDLNPARWKALVNDSKNYSDNDFVILPSEEISCTVPCCLLQEYNHYLSYNITDFIPGGEWEDGTGSHYNCSELVSMVNEQGGFGYPAHPMYDDIFREPWYDYSLNFSGLEIWNGAGNIGELDSGLDKWVELLLGGRKIFVEAGSDAHGDFNSGFGKVRTMVYATSLSDNEILSAMKKGHSIMTDGPVVVFDINGTIIGDTLEISNGSSINLNIQWNSTPEFGKLENITIIGGYIGSEEIIEEIIYPDSFSGTHQTTIIPSQNVYYRFVAFTSTGYRAYTNPVWINVSDVLPEIHIRTDKTTYTTGDIMNVGLNITNPGDAINAGIYVWVDLPGGGKFLVVKMPSATLPADFDYSNQAWQTITLPPIMPGDYAWHAVLTKPPGNEIISESIQPWIFTGAVKLEAESNDELEKMLHNIPEEIVYVK